MKNLSKFVIKNIYEGTIVGILMMSVVCFLLMLTTYYAIMKISDHNGRVCNYSGKFWIDDSKDKNTEGDLKGCFTWEEMIEMERL